MTEIAVRAGVVATKLHVPEPPAGAVPRERLLERLDVSAHRVVLIAAPAGFGKTVLVTQWLRRSNVPTVWISLDELDNDPRRFLVHIAAAFDSLGDRAGRVASLLRGLRAGSQPGRSAELHDALQQLGECTVVLDDLHLLDEDGVLAQLRGLLEMRLPSLRFLLLTRVDPPLPLGRLRASGELLEIREQDLRFNTAEAVLLFNELLTGGLEPELVQRLESRTEGWAAGLRMAAIALEQAADRRAAVDAFTGSHRYVADYLIEEAVGRQRPAVQQFLMQTSVLPRFTAESCAAVLQDESAPALLAEVEAAHLFVVPLGPERQWFRYHHLFAELLQYRLKRLHPELADTLHERASRWFEEQGDHVSAVEHAARMTRRDRLAALLDRHAFQVLSRSEMVTLSRWLHQVPDILLQPWPTLLLSLGWIRTITEREPDLEPLFDAVRAALASAPAGYDDAAVTTARHELETLRAYHARFCGRYDESLGIGAALLARLPADAVALRGRVLFNQARVLMMQGDMTQAAALLERSVEDNLRAGTHYLVLAGMAQQAAVLLETHGVQAARTALETTVRFATQTGLTRLPAYSIVLFHLGHVHVVADELEDAVVWLEQARTLGEAGDMPDGRANALADLARAHAARGRFEEANAMLVELEALARTQNIGLIDGDIAVPRRRHELYLHAAGLLPALPQEIGMRALAATEWSVAAEAHDVCRVIETLRAPAGKPDAQAEGAADRIVAGSGARGRRLAPCIARVAQAALTADSSRWQLLDAALSEAGSLGCVRPLLEIGPPLQPLLQASLGQRLSPAARTHAALLLARLGHTGEKLLQTAVAPLTDREREVLAHLGRGLSNKAIARSMFVSPETVKTHVKHVFDKLGISRRRDAAARARSLGIVDG
jgi:LuxR family transcriptional regulator, maltose regulon positive regulatory protein